MGSLGQAAAAPGTNWLRPIHTPPTPTLDVVAVYGMNTKDQSNQGDTAWIDPESKTHWLRDMLPHELPDARILSYDYNANVIFKASTAGIEQQALNLLNCLKSERKGDASIRPIIFITNSLGGVIVKSALALAYHGDGTHAASWVFTYGVLFFGVPHRGTMYATWGEVVADMLGIYPGTQNTSFVSSVERSSAYNDKLNEQFKPLLDAYIFCSVCTPVPEPSHAGIAVDEDSAILGLPDGQECKIFLDRSHTGTCTFSGSQNGDFAKVMEPLRAAANAATSSFDYSPTMDVRARMLRSIAFPTEKNPERVPSFHDAERFIKLVLINAGDLEEDLKKANAEIDLQIYYMEGLLRWLQPSATILRGMSVLGPIAPAVWALGGVRSLMEKHEKGLRAQAKLVELQREAITLLDERRSSALRAIGMVQSSKGLGPVSPAPTGDTSANQEKPPEDSESKLLGRIEWMVCELHSRNQRLIEAERDVREGEEFKESAKGKTDKEILVLAKARIQQAKKNAPSRHDRWRRECVIL